MVILLAAASLPASALFPLQRIEVEGAKTLTPDAVRAASGLEPGSRSIFTINAQEVTRRLLRHPWIASAPVRARPPPPTLLRLPPRGPGGAAQLQVTRTREVFLYTTDGLEIRAGPLRGLRQRIAAAPEILRTVRAQGTPLEYIDLSLPDKAIIKPRTVP